MNTSNMISKALAWSGYLQRKVLSNTHFEQELQQYIQQTIDNTLIQQWFDEIKQSPTTATLNPEACKTALRRLRDRLFCTLLVRDINGLAQLEEVTQSMSFLADLAVQESYKSIMTDLVEVHGTPIDATTGKPLEMIILGMGKLGGNELNVSSDIDLIMLYSEDGETTGRRKISYHEFYGRLTQRMMPIISEQTAEGRVFRTDLRLRPDGDAGPLAWSFNSLENYLVVQGREWERYAWLKARPIEVKAFADSEPEANLQYLENLRIPFVYRKYFDFNALSALRDLREKIRLDLQRKVLKRSGSESTHNIKLGDGGIREIEFVVQLSQLIRGGRLPSLRERNLLCSLKTESEAGLIDDQTAEKLAQAYRFLRKVEHTLQYREDEQTHLLPHEPEKMEALALAMGFDNSDAFSQCLTAHRDFVNLTFKNAFRLAGIGEEEKEDTSSSITSENEENDDPIQANIKIAIPEEYQATISSRIDALLNSNKVRRLSNSSQARLNQLLPNVLLKVAKYEDPVTTCSRLLDLIEAIASRSSYLALFVEYPETLDRVTRMISASPWAAQYLTQNPILLDSLIEWHSLLEPVDFKQVAQQLKTQLDACKFNGQCDIEQQMNIMRDAQKQVSFQLLAQDLQNVLSVEALADNLSALADIMLKETIQRVWPLVYKNDPENNPPKFAVIAYGKLGGKELGYASDLDIVLLYDDRIENAAETYAKLGRRLSTWLSTMTSSGRLYEIDLRLRPDGDAGLLAVSVEAFENYQRNHAWVWEHQAITRARFAAGDTSVGQAFEKVREQILLLPRDPITLKEEIIEMRKKIRAGHPNNSQLFDVKHDEGGMVDIEFTTQYLVLAYSHQYPKLIENLGNIALLKTAGEVGLIDKTLALKVADAYRILRKKQHEVRLQGKEKARINKTLLIPEREAVQHLWHLVFDKYID